MNRQILLSILIFAMPACLSETELTSESPPPEDNYCAVTLTILGHAQDAGKPQIGYHADSAWENPADTVPAASLGITFNVVQKRYLIDATPDIKEQLYMMDELYQGEGYQLDGLFLTHAHIGHYLGLAQFGREAMGATNLPVYAMPKMKSFLENNGPWDMLVRLENIALQPLSDSKPVTLGDGFHITPFLVPHRDEYSETVGYRISSLSQSAIYLPDIDNWDAWQAQGTDIADVIKDNDLIFIDGTFYSGDELPGRDMSQIPHPTISHTMKRLTDLPILDKAKVYFIHLNHSNPAHDPYHESAKDIRRNGFDVARTGRQFCLN